MFLPIYSDSLKQYHRSSSRKNLYSSLRISSPTNKSDWQPYAAKAFGLYCGWLLFAGMSPGRTSGAPSPLSGAEGACGGVGNAESEALGRSGSVPHEEIKRAATIKITLSTFNFPFI